MTDEQMLQAMKSLIDPLRVDISDIKSDISSLKEDVSSLKAGQAALEQSVASLKEDVSGLKEDVSGLKEDVQGVKLVLENEIRPQIRLLAEQHGDIVQKLKQTEDIVDMKSNIQDLQRVVTIHTGQIKDLQRAQG